MRRLCVFQVRAAAAAPSHLPPAAWATPPPLLDKCSKAGPAPLAAVLLSKLTLAGYKSESPGGPGLQLDASVAAAELLLGIACSEERNEGGTDGGAAAPHGGAANFSAAPIRRLPPWPSPSLAAVQAPAPQLFSVGPPAALVTRVSASIWLPSPNSASPPPPGDPAASSEMLVDVKCGGLTAAALPRQMEVVLRLALASQAADWAPPPVSVAAVRSSSLPPAGAGGAARPEASTAAGSRVRLTAAVPRALLACSVEPSDALLQPLFLAPDRPPGAGAAALVALLLSDAAVEVEAWRRPPPPPPLLRASPVGVDPELKEREEEQQGETLQEEDVTEGILFDEEDELLFFSHQPAAAEGAAGKLDPQQHQVKMHAAREVGGSAVRLRVASLAVLVASAPHLSPASAIRSSSKCEGRRLATVVGPLKGQGPLLQRDAQPALSFGFLVRDYHHPSPPTGKGRHESAQLVRFSPLPTLPAVPAPAQGQELTLAAFPLAVRADPELIRLAVFFGVSARQLNDAYFRPALAAEAGSFAGRLRFNGFQFLLLPCVFSPAASSLSSPGRAAPSWCHPGGARWWGRDPRGLAPRPSPIRLLVHDGLQGAVLALTADDAIMILHDDAADWDGDVSAPPSPLHSQSAGPSVSAGHNPPPLLSRRRLDISALGTSLRMIAAAPRSPEDPVPAAAAATLMPPTDAHVGVALLPPIVVSAEASSVDLQLSPPLLVAAAAAGLAAASAAQEAVAGALSAFPPRSPPAPRAKAGAAGKGSAVVGDPGPAVHHDHQDVEARVGRLRVAWVHLPGVCAAADGGHPIDADGRGECEEGIVDLETDRDILPLKAVAARRRRAVHRLFSAAVMAREASELAVVQVHHVGVALRQWPAAQPQPPGSEGSLAVAAGGMFSLFVTEPVSKLDLLFSSSLHSPHSLSLF